MTPLKTRQLARRSLLHGLVFLFAAGFLVSLTGPAHADRPAAFMKSVGNKLIAAARTGSPYKMYEIIRAHSDLPDIGLFSLGSYRKQLPSSRRSSYYDGVARFMTRYFIGQAKRYQVMKLDVYRPSSRVNWGHKVDSRVTLRDGSTYKLRWHVVPRRGGLKIRDVAILGVWLTPISLTDQQRNLFENYISENGGKVSALLSALGG